MGPDVEYARLGTPDFECHGYHSAATQKSRESAGDAVFGRRSVDRTEGSKKLNSG